MNDKLPTKNRISNFFARALSLSKDSLLRQRARELEAQQKFEEQQIETSKTHEEAKLQEVRHENLDKIVEQERERLGKELDIKYREDMRDLRERESRLEISESEEIEERRKKIEKDEYIHDLDKREYVMNEERQKFSSEEEKAGGHEWRLDKHKEIDSDLENAIDAIKERFPEGSKRDEAIAREKVIADERREVVDGDYLKR